jgi:hypothetical protein
MQDFVEACRQLFLGCAPIALIAILIFKVRIRK